MIFIFKYFKNVKQYTHVTNFFIFFLFWLNIKKILKAETSSVKISCIPEEWVF